MTRKIPLILFAIFCYLLFPYSLPLAGEYHSTQESVNTILDKSLLLSVTEVIKQKKQNPLLILVDVRGETAFKKNRIPDSINIPLSFVKTKQYLRNMKIVLVGNGFNFKILLQEAKLLKKKGFDIFVLAGGLAAWHQQGGKLEGDLFDLGKFHLIPPHYLLSGNRSPLLKNFIDISLKQNQDIPIDFPDVLHVPIRRKEDLQKLITVIEKENTGPLSAALIFNNDGNYESVASLTELIPSTIYYLKDGLNGYHKVVRQHQAMLQSREERLKTVGGCATCPNAEKGQIKSQNITK